MRSPRPGRSPARPFCTKVVFARFLHPGFCNFVKCVGVVKKGVLIVAVSDSYQPPNRASEASESADFPSGWHDDWYGYSPTW